MCRRFSMWMMVSLLSLVGCDGRPASQTSGKVTLEDVSRDGGQAINTAAKFSEQAMETFQKDLDARIKAADAEIAKLREKGQDLKDQAKVKWERKLVELEAKRDSARAKLVEVSQSSAAAWEDVRRGAQSAWEELDKAFHEASREF